MITCSQADNGCSKHERTGSGNQLRLSANWSPRMIPGESRTTPVPGLPRSRVPRTREPRTWLITWMRRRGALPARSIRQGSACGHPVPQAAGPWRGWQRAWGQQQPGRSWAQRPNGARTLPSSFPGGQLSSGDVCAETAPGLQGKDAVLQVWLPRLHVPVGSPACHLCF